VVPLLGAPLLGRGRSLVNGGSLVDLLGVPLGLPLGLGLGLGLGVGLGPEPPLVFGDGLGLVLGLGLGLGVADLVEGLHIVVGGNRLGDGRSKSLSGEESNNGGKSELHFEVFEGRRGLKAKCGFKRL